MTGYDHMGQKHTAACFSGATSLQRGSFSWAQHARQWPVAGIRNHVDRQTTNRSESSRRERTSRVNKCTPHPSSTVSLTLLLLDRMPSCIIHLSPTGLSSPVIDTRFRVPARCRPLFCFPSRRPWRGRVSTATNPSTLSSKEASKPTTNTRVDLPARHILHAGQGTGKLSMTQA